MTESYQKEHEMKMLAALILFPRSLWQVVATWSLFNNNSEICIVCGYFCASTALTSGIRILCTFSRPEAETSSVYIHVAQHNETSILSEKLTEYSVLSLILEGSWQIASHTLGMV